MGPVVYRFSNITKLFYLTYFRFILSCQTSQNMNEHSNLVPISAYRLIITLLYNISPQVLILAVCKIVETVQYVICTMHF